jgi:hypothetical protein
MLIVDIDITVCDRKERKGVCLNANYTILFRGCIWTGFFVRDDDALGFSIRQFQFWLQTISIDVLCKKSHALIFILHMCSDEELLVLQQ